MAIISVVDTDTFDIWRQKTNLLSQQQGDLDLLLTSVKTDLVSAINEVFSSLNDSGREILIRSIFMS